MRIPWTLPAVAAAAIAVAAPTASARPQYGQQVDAFCSSQPFQGDCLLCHDPRGKALPTPQKAAFLAGDLCFFCPNDANCSAGPTCTDADGDGFAVEGGACGPVDCNDADPAINPGAPEVCTDGIDNNCNGLTDAMDPAAVGCPPSCTDADGDGFAVEGGACGPVDCDDADPAINPAAPEVCGDAVDNDCDGMIDEGCQPMCPDNDGDGFTAAVCGGADCDDTDPAIHPGAAEVCGNGIDEDCDGRDLPCPTGGDGAALFGQMCAGCHGANGCGGPEEAVHGADAEEIGEALQEVPEMAGLPPLTDADLEAIADFLSDPAVTCGGDEEGPRGRQPEGHEGHEEHQKRHRRHGHHGHDD